MDIQELKAHAFDCLATIEAWQKELRLTQEKIAALMEQESKAVETKEEDQDGK